MFFFDFSKIQFWKIWNQKNQIFQNFEEILGIGRWKFFKFASKSLPGPMVCLWIWKFWKFCSKLKKNGRSSTPAVRSYPPLAAWTGHATAPSRGTASSSRYARYLISSRVAPFLPLFFSFSSSFFSPLLLLFFSLLSLSLSSFFFFFSFRV